MIGEQATPQPSIRGGTMANRRLTKEERGWRAEEDARMLAEVEIIKETPSRLGEAKKAARRMADEETKKAQKMRTVANTRERKATTTPPKDQQTKKRNRKSPANRPSKFNVFGKV